MWKRNQLVKREAEWKWAEMSKKVVYQKMWRKWRNIREENIEMASLLWNTAWKLSMKAICNQLINETIMRNEYKRMNENEG